MNLDNKIIICPKNVGRVFLAKRREDPTLDFTMFDLLSLQRQLFGDFTKTAVNYLLQNTNYPLKSIQTELNYIVRGIGEEEGTPEIRDIYKQIIDNDLLVIDDLVIELFKHKDVIVVGYSSKNLELQHVLNKLNVSNVEYAKLTDIVPQTKPTLLEFKTIDEEIRYVFNLILREDNEKLSKGEALSKKCIVCNNQDYESYLKMYADRYEIKLYFKNPLPVKEMTLAKELLERAKDTTSKDPFAFLSELHTPVTYGGADLIKPLQIVINDYLTYKDSDGNILKDNEGNPIYVKNLYENLSILLDSVVAVAPHYTNEVLVTSQPDFNSNIEYYVLGASDSFLPKLSKNNELLDDAVLIKNKINSSLIKNIESSEEAEAFVNSKYIKHISYYQTKGKDNVFHTTIIDDKQVIKPIKLPYDYSTDIALAYFSKAKDIEYKYNEATFDLAFESALKDKGVVFGYYDSSFRGLIQDDPNRTLCFSYSSMNELYECPFKYFVDHILHMGEFESFYGAKLGTLAHKAFEYINELEFDEAWEKALSNIDINEFTPKEKIFLDANKDSIKDAYNNIKERMFNSGFVKQSKSEYRRTYTLKENELKINGSIDNFVINEDSEIVILDYKTGSFEKGNQEKYEQGLNLQLLMYSYMLSLDEEYKDKEVVGIYYCPVLPFALNKQSAKYQEKMKFAGLTFKEVIPDAKEFIKAYKVSTAIKPLNENLELVRNKIEEAETLVRESKFNIKPAPKSGACKYCSYKDLCFKTRAFKDRPHMKEEEAEEKKEHEDEE